MATVSETREVAGFDGIELKGAGVLHVSQGESTSLRIEAEPDTLSRIATEVEGNRLVIRFRWLDVFLAFKAMGPIDFYVTTPHLRAVKIAGSGRLVGDTPINGDRLYLSMSGSGKVALNLDVEELRVVVSGSGDLDLKGTAGRQELSVSGTCDYRAAYLETKGTDITIAGSGRAQVHATEHLDVSISGSGRVEYAGIAQVTQRISGSGSVLRLVDGSPAAAAAAWDAQPTAEAAEAVPDAPAEQTGADTGPEPPAAQDE